VTQIVEVRKKGHDAGAIVAMLSERFPSLTKRGVTLFSLSSHDDVVRVEIPDGADAERIAKAIRAHKGQ
jgi:hypothetical protein